MGIAINWDVTYANRSAETLLNDFEECSDDPEDYAGLRAEIIRRMKLHRSGQCDGMMPWRHTTKDGSVHETIHCSMPKGHDNVQCHDDLAHLYFTPWAL